MSYKNPTDKQTYEKAWYQKNKDKRRIYLNKNNIARRKRNQKLMLNYLKNKFCEDCSESDIVVLDFDHVRGKKKTSIANMVCKAYSEKTLLEEMKKCEVVCSNCHRRRTSKRGGHYKQMPC